MCEAGTTQRQLSGPERMMKNMTDNGVYTIGSVWVVSTHNEMTFEALSDIVDILYTKYDMLKMNVAWDKQHQRFYWHKVAKEDAFSTCNYGRLSHAELFSKFENELYIGVKDKDPLWRVAFANLKNYNPQPSATHTSCSSAENTAIPSNSSCLDFYPKRVANSWSAPNETATASHSNQSSSQIYHSAFCFICSHALLDGVGMLHVGSYFVRLVSFFLKNGCLPDHASEPVVGLGPPYESLIPEARYIGLIRALLFVARATFKFNIRRNKVPLIRHRIFTTPKCRPRFWDRPALQQSSHSQLIVIPSDQLLALKKIKNDINGNFSGLLMSVLSTAFVKFAYEGNDWPSTSFAYTLLRDPRRYFNRQSLTEAAFVANYIASGMLLLVRMKKLKELSLRDYMFNLSKQITRDIKAGVGSLQAIKNATFWVDVFKNPSLVKDCVEIFSKDRRSAGRFCLFQFSNVGESTIDNIDEDLYINELHAIANQAKCGDCFCNFLVTVNGILYWSLCYPTHIFDDERMKEFKTHIIECLNHLLDEDTS